MLGKNNMVRSVTPGKEVALDLTFGGSGMTTGGLGVLGSVIFHGVSGLYGKPQSLPSKEPQICVGVA